MIVTDVFVIKSRGPVACVTLEAVLGPQPGDTLRRSDGASWRISGVDWYAMPRSPTRPGKGDKVGLLLPRDADVKAGDVVEVVPSVIQIPNPDAPDETEPQYADDEPAWDAEKS